MDVRRKRIDGKCCEAQQFQPVILNVSLISQSGCFVMIRAFYQDPFYTTSCAKLLTPDARLLFLCCHPLGWRSASTPSCEQHRPSHSPLHQPSSLQGPAFLPTLIKALIRRVWIRGLEADRKTTLTCCFNYRAVCLCRAQRRKDLRGLKRMREWGEEGGRYGLCNSYLISASVFHST